MRQPMPLPQRRVVYNPKDIPGAAVAHGSDTGLGTARRKRRPEAEMMGPAAIAKHLSIARSSVYRMLEA